VVQGGDALQGGLRGPGVAPHGLEGRAGGLERGRGAVAGGLGRLGGGVCDQEAEGAALVGLGRLGLEELGHLGLVGPGGTKLCRRRGHLMEMGEVGVGVEYGWGFKGGGGYLGLVVGAEGGESYQQGAG